LVTWKNWFWDIFWAGGLGPLVTLKGKVEAGSWDQVIKLLATTEPWLESHKTYMAHSESAYRKAQIPNNYFG
jgi:hypothetical protein